jgi:DNA-directed RNA polymerase specialized sigma24 family protein
MAKQADFGFTAAGRQIAITALYKKAFPLVAKYIAKMGGSFDDAKDVFQDALVIYYEKTMSGAAALPASENAYLVGIAKHLWLRKYREHTRYAGIGEMDFAAENSEGLPTGKLMRYLETAGQKCMDLLKAFYYDSLSADKIAELFGYSGVRSATVQKYKCMEKVRETIKEKSLAYEDFVE